MNITQRPDISDSIPEFVPVLLQTDSELDEEWLTDLEDDGVDEIDLQVTFSTAFPLENRNRNEDPETMDTTGPKSNRDNRTYIHWNENPGLFVTEGPSETDYIHEEEHFDKGRLAFFKLWDYYALG